MGCGASKEEPQKEKDGNQSEKKDESGQQNSSSDGVQQNNTGADDESGELSKKGPKSFGEAVNDTGPAHGCDNPSASKYGMGGVISTHFSLDDKYLFCGGDDGFLHCFEGTTADTIWKLKAHRSAVTGIVSTKPKSALGHCVFTSSRDGNIGCWAADDGNLHFKLSGHILAVNCLALLQSKLVVYSGSADKTILSWDRHTKKEVNKYTGHNGQVWSLAVSVDGTKLFSCSDDRTVKIWKSDQVECLHTLEGHRGPIYCVLGSVCGKYLFSSGRDRTVARWDVKTGKKEQIAVSQSEAVTSITASADGHTIYAVGNAIQLWQWEDEDASIRSSFRSYNFPAQNEDGLFTCAACSPDNLRLAVGRDISGFRVLDTRDYSLPTILNHHKGTVASLDVYEPKGLVACGSEDTTITIWKLNSGHIVKKLEGHTSRVWSVCFSADAVRLYSGSEDSTVRVWAVDTGRCLQVIRAHAACVWAVSLVPGSAREIIASTGDDMVLFTWHKNAQGKFEKEQSFTGHKSPVVCLAAANGFSLDEVGFEQCIATGSFDTTIALWLVSSGEREVLHGHTEVVWTLRFVASKNWLLSGSEDKTLRVWDLTSLSCSRVIDFSSAVAALAICKNPLLSKGTGLTADQIVLLVGLADGTLKECNPEDTTESCVRGFFGGTGKGHTASVCAVISTEMATVTGSVDMTARYWPHRAAGTALKLHSMHEVSTLNPVVVSPSSPKTNKGKGSSSGSFAGESGEGDDDSPRAKRKVNLRRKPQSKYEENS